MTSAMGPGVRREHEQRVLTALRDNGARSRAELGELVGLSRSSLSEVTTSLLDRGVIIVLDKDAAPRRGAGRPAERLALDPSSGQYIGLDFQHARVDVVVADATHEILGAGTSPYELESPWHERMQVAFNLIDGVAEKANAHFGALAWIYAGVPGPYVPPSARVTLPAFWERSRINGYGVREALSGRYGAPTSIDNNTRLAALAEAKASGAQDLVYIRLGQGVGGGLVQAGRLTRGTHSLAGALGHAPVPGRQGRCRCGKSGCLETVAALPEVLNACADAGVATRDSLIAPDDLPAPAVQQITVDVASAMSAVLLPVVMALDPEEVVVAGPVLELLPGLLLRVQEALMAQRFTGLDVPRVRGPLVTAHEGALGALQAGYDAQALESKGTT
jgi:predicted NBD/HSP70 family sugar kinase